MKISGTRSIITFDYENGYVLKAEGELLTDGSFTVYRSSIQNWEPPYNHIRITQNKIDKLVEEVYCMMTEQTIQIEFIWVRVGEGEKIDQIESPAGFTMLYIYEISKEKLRIVCEALKEDCFDKSGRSDFYFNLDLETRQWVKDGFAYWGRKRSLILWYSGWEKNLH